MRIIPVMDLMNGQVVRGIAGRRHEYRPIQSLLTPACDVLSIARAFRVHFGLTYLYVADLDAIAGKPPALRSYDTLVDDGFHLCIDFGVRTPGDLDPLLDRPSVDIVVGLETVRDELVLDTVCGRIDRRRLVFSLDLRAGVLLAGEAWRGQTAESIADRAVAAGFRRILVLDLADVGVGTGTSTEHLCRQIASCHREVDVITGGGVRDRQDVVRIRKWGVNGLLVASALHDGRLRKEDFV